MTNEMIERLAKTLYDSVNNERIVNDMRKPIEIYKIAARAAIQAMYEPTDQQRNFYYDLKRESGSIHMYSTFEDATWQMMIEACLLERRIG